MQIDRKSIQSQLERCEENVAQLKKILSLLNELEKEAEGLCQEDCKVKKDRLGRILDSDYSKLYNEGNGKSISCPQYETGSLRSAYLEILNTRMPMSAKDVQTALHKKYKLAKDIKSIHHYLWWLKECGAIQRTCRGRYILG